MALAMILALFALRHLAINWVHRGRAFRRRLDRSTRVVQAGLPGRSIPGDPGQPLRVCAAIRRDLAAGLRMVDAGSG
jgi:hypothetical protein